MYFRLSSFYFFYFAALGALIPYWSVYLQSRGFGAAQIGELVAILMATKIIAPNVWGWMADHSGRRMRIIRIASLLAALSFGGVYLAQGYWSLALVMVAFSFFWNAALPQFEAATLTHLGEATQRYSMIRLWGSIGFIVTVAGLGPVLGHLGAGALPHFLLALFAGIWLASLLVPEGRRDPEPHGEPIWRVLGRREVVALLLVCFLMQMSHGPYYTFFTIYMEEHGHSRALVGQLWALGVIAEILVFLVMHRWLPRFGPRRLLLASLTLTSLRWLLIAGFPDRLGVILFAQTLHAASFGVYHAVAIHLVHEYFRGRLQGRGQALYSSLSFGAGGAVGSLAAGYAWSGLGAGGTFGLAAAVSLAGLLVAWLGVRAATPSAAAEDGRDGIQQSHQERLVEQVDEQAVATGERQPTHPAQ